MAQESSEEEGNTKRDEEVTVEKDVQVTIEEKLEEVDLGTNPQEPKPISISSKLLEEEKSKLILLLKEFKDVFTWDYSEMPVLDPGLVMHTLNMDPEAKLMAQTARVFHTEIKEQIVKEVHKLLAAGFLSPSSIHIGCPTLYQ